MKTRWFFLFFFISGFCSLVYEVVWLRLAMARFGVTTPMVSIVLSVFMAGLGLGSWGGGAIMRRCARRPAAVPLRMYGALELSIGISALVVPVVLDLGYRMIRDLGRGVAWGSSVYYLVSGAWVAIALLPWTTCMGATFPFAMSAISSLRPKESSHSFSYLYLANVMGAIAGTLVPALVLIELFGFRTTLYIASLLNFALAALVFQLSRSLGAVLVKVEEEAVKEHAAGPGVDVLWFLFATGLCSMAIEVVWIRSYTVYLGNVVYAFAAILAIYLLATYHGSYLYRRRAKVGHTGDLAWIFAGFAALLPLIFTDPRLNIGDGFGSGALRAVLGIAPFSGIAGYLTPMLVDRWSGGDPARAGRAYSVNVLGSILGPLVAGFGVILLAGERWGLCILAAPLFAIGLIAAMRSRHAWVRPLFTGALLLSAGTIALTRGYETQFPQKVELRDSTATVIATGTGMDSRLLVNGIGMTRLTTITKMMAHLPLAMLPRPAQNGLVICFGMGTSFRSMLSWGVRTTVVDLVPSVPKLFGYYHADAAEVMSSPLARVVADDGRRFLERSGEQYDVIITDPPPPVSAPTSSLLYSEEFYAIVKAHLRPGGIAQIWVPGGDDATLSAIVKSLRNSFADVRALGSVEGWGSHFVASMQPLPNLDARTLAARVPARAVADMLEWKPNTTPEALFSAMLDGEEPLQDYIDGAPAVPPITDNRPINEYFLIRALKSTGESKE